MDNIDFLRTLKFLPGIILGLTVHEFSHAWVALLCGDPTARDEGRITLNPFKHIDMLGFIMLLVAGFGWAKPVQFTEQNLRNPKTDVLKIAVAGPLSNALLAMVLSVVFSFLPPHIPIYSNDPIRMAYEVLHYAILLTGGFLCSISSPSLLLTALIYSLTSSRDFRLCIQDCINMAHSSF